MVELDSYDDIIQIINKNKLAIVYFTGKKCGACDVIKSKVENIISKYNKLKSCQINGEDNLDIGIRFQVYSVPLLLLFVEGKESIRVGRNINLMEIEDIINRYYELLF